MLEKIDKKNMDDFLQSPIPYYKPFTRIMGNISGGIFLSYIYHIWYKSSEDWNYKPKHTLVFESGLDLYELRRGRDKAIKLRIIECQNRKITDSTTNKPIKAQFYKINKDILYNLTLQHAICTDF